MATSAMALQNINNYFTVAEVKLETHEDLLQTDQFKVCTILGSPIIQNSQFVYKV